MHETFAKVALGLQLFLIIMYGIFTDYASGASASGSTASDNSTTAGAAADGGVSTYYPFFQDVHVMIFIGFGFLMTFLKRYSLSSVGFNFWIAALAIQMSMLIDGFFHRLHENHFDERLHFEIKSLIRGDFAAGAVLISFGAVLGRANSLQLLVMTILELIVYAGNETIGALEFKAVDMGGSIFVHLFGALFGVAVSTTLDWRRKRATVAAEQGRAEESEHAREGSTRNSDTFAMVGTLFLWMFWPSFNGALATGASQHRVVINTVLALTASCITAYSVSALLTHGRKFDMVHIQNATLAGGVGVGSSADLVIQPWGAVLLGCVAGGISVLGYVYIQPFLKRKFGLMDTCGVMNLHGLPGLIGAISGAIAAGVAGDEQYGQNIAAVFPARAADSEGWSAGEQAAHQVYALLVTFLLAPAGGFVVGNIMSNPMLKPVSADAWFDDGPDWEEVPSSIFEDEAAGSIKTLQAEVAELADAVRKVQEEAKGKEESDGDGKSPDVEMVSDNQV